MVQQDRVDPEFSMVWMGGRHGLGLRGVYVSSFRCHSPGSGRALRLFVGNGAEVVGCYENVMQIVGFRDFAIDCWSSR